MNIHYGQSGNSQKNRTDVSRLIRTVVKDIYLDRIKNKTFLYTLLDQSNQYLYHKVYRKETVVKNKSTEYILEYGSSNNLYTIKVFINKRIDSKIVESESAHVTLEWSDFEDLIGRLSHRWITDILYKS